MMLMMSLFLMNLPIKRMIRLLWMFLLTFLTMMMVPVAVRFVLYHLPIDINLWFRSNRVGCNRDGLPRGKRILSPRILSRMVSEVHFASSNEGPASHCASGLSHDGPPSQTHMFLKIPSMFRGEPNTPLINRSFLQMIDSGFRFCHLGGSKRWS